MKGALAWVWSHLGWGLTWLPLRTQDWLYENWKRERGET